MSDCPELLHLNGLQIFAPDADGKLVIVANIASDQLLAAEIVRRWNHRDRDRHRVNTWEGMLDALKELKRIGDEGMKSDYNEWQTTHDLISKIAGEAINQSEMKV